MEPDLAHLRVHVEERIAWVTIDNPPINVLTKELFIELHQLADWLEPHRELTVVVLQSEDPDFFIAHYDVEAILGFDRHPDFERPTEPNAFHVTCGRFSTMDKVTIAKIAGRVGGGGSELVMALDLRYGALGRAVVNQMEVPIGILPGGGGTQRLPHLVGSSRAAEVILGGVDLDAATGERWGYFTRALPPDELDDYVDGLARRISSFSPDAVRAAKASLAAARPDLTTGLVTESGLFQDLLRTDAAPALLERFLERGGQTRAGELRLAELVEELADG